MIENADIATQYAHDGRGCLQYSYPTEFIQLPVSLEVVASRNDAPGSRRMRLCQTSYALHPAGSVGTNSEAESAACALWGCSIDAGRCIVGRSYALSAISQCGAVQNVRSAANGKRHTKNVPVF